MWLKNGIKALSYLSIVIFSTHLLPKINCLNLCKQRAFKVKSMYLNPGPDKVWMNNLSLGLNEFVYVFFLTWLKANHCNLLSVEMSMPSSSSSWSYRASNYSNSSQKTDMHNRCATLSYYVTNLSMTTNLSFFSFLVYIERI